MLITSLNKSNKSTTGSADHNVSLNSTMTRWLNESEPSKVVHIASSATSALHGSKTFNLSTYNDVRPKTYSLGSSSSTGLRFTVFPNELHRAAGSARDISIAKVSDILDQGVPVDEIDDSGRTPLLRAAYWGNNVAILRLLERGACVNFQDSLGYSALILAAMGGKEMSVSLLLEHGANPLLRCRGGTALDEARRYNMLEVVKILDTHNTQVI